MDYKDYLEQKEETGTHFWYKARLALLIYLLEKAFLQRNIERKILNIGCGTGTENKEIQKFGQLTALDISQDALNEVKHDDCKVLLGNIETIELKKDYFDGVCAFDILEHLDEDKLVMKKICDSLKTGGKLLFTVPSYQYLYGSHDIALEHKRRYNKKEVGHKLERAGFKLIEMGYWNSILFPLETVFRIVKKYLFKILGIKNHTTEVKFSNGFMNSFLYLIMNQDIKLIRKKLGLPFGLTIYGIVEKK